MAAALLALAVPVSTRADEPPADLLARTDPGRNPTAFGVEVDLVDLPDEPVRAGRARITIHAPLPDVTRTLTTYDGYPELLPQFQEARVIHRRRGGETEVYFRAFLTENLGTVWSLVRFTVTRTATRTVVQGESVDGSFRRAHAEFVAEMGATPGETRVTLTLLGVPSFPIPIFLLPPISQRWAARGLVALRRRVESTAPPAVPGSDAGVPDAAR